DPPLRHHRAAPSASPGWTKPLQDFSKLRTRQRRLSPPRAQTASRPSHPYRAEPHTPRPIHRGNRKRGGLPLAARPVWINAWPMTAWPDRSVFVTGAYGLLGSWLVKALLERGASVTVLKRDAVSASALVLEGTEQRVNVVQGDVCDPGLLE